MKKSVLFIICAIILFLIKSCNLTSQKVTSDKEDNQEIAKLSSSSYNINRTQFTSFKMKVQKLEQIVFHELVNATGMFDVRPENRANVSSYFGGTVQGIKLLPGEYVRKGELLFSLENPDFIELQQDYLEAKGKLIYLKSDFERQKNLVKDNVTSQKIYLRSENDYTTVKVKSEALKKKLRLIGINPDVLTMYNIQSNINIISPIDGYITNVNITRGSFLDPSQIALTIVNLDHLHLELNIFEKDFLKVNEGQTILFNLQNDDSMKYKAIVHLVNKTVDLEMRTIGIHAHLLDNKLSSKFNPGMYLDAVILTNSQKKFALPEDAIVTIDNKSYVLELVSSTNDVFTFNKREVIAGLLYDGYIEIINYKDFGLDSEILTFGAFNLIAE